LMVFTSFWTAHPAQSNVSWLYSSWEIGPSWTFKSKQVLEVVILNLSTAKECFALAL
jgi:hypothetical protein